MPSTAHHPFRAMRRRADGRPSLEPCSCTRESADRADRAMRRADMPGRRWWALAALLLALVAVGLAVATAVAHFPSGISVLLCLSLAVACVWHGVQRRRYERLIWFSAAGLLLIG